MSFEQSQWVWMNGKLINWSDATLHVSSHALHYGSGVFEGIRCYQTVDGPALFRLDAHLAGGFLSEEQAHEGIDGLLKGYRERFQPHV